MPKDAALSARLSRARVGYQHCIECGAITVWNAWEHELHMYLTLRDRLLMSLPRLEAYTRHRTLVQPVMSCGAFHGLNGTYYR